MTKSRLSSFDASFQFLSLLGELIRFALFILYYLYQNDLGHSGHHPKLSKSGTVISDVEPRSLCFKQPHRHNKQSVNQSQTLINAAFELGCPSKSLPNHCHFLTGVSSTHPPRSPNVSGLSNVYWTVPSPTQVPLGPQHCWLPLLPQVAVL